VGKQVTIVSGFSSVGLPQAGNPSKPFSAGQTAVLTDAEYAALPSSVTRALTGVTTVAEPSRPSTDPNAKSVNIVAAATGTVTAKSGINRFTLTGNLTLAFPSGATVSTETEVSLVLIQDATGSRTLTLPASAKKPGGTAVVLTTAAGSVDYLRFITVDGGVTWLLVIKQLDIK
jgi:hypothetical protein